MRRRTGIAAAAAALVLASAPAARAAEQQAYAVGLNYATPVVAASQGDTLRFNNLDPLGGHDIRSVTPGLFSSPVIGGGENSGLDPRMLHVLLWNFAAFAAYGLLVVWRRYQLERGRQQLNALYRTKGAA